MIVVDYFKDLYHATVDGWNRFWFTPTDPATLGLIRILAGTMVFYTHLVWSIDLQGFFGEQGRLSPTFVNLIHQGKDSAWSYLHLVDHSPGLLWAAHIIALVILLMFTVGLFTRTTGVLAFIICISYVNRVPGSLFGLDQINTLLITYLMLGGAGKAYSLDRWIARRQGKKVLEIDKNINANISIRLIQIHMCIMYLFAGLGKLQGDTWWDGTATWMGFANTEYRSFDVTWLAAYPLVINLMTQVSLAWEIGYAALVWPRWTRPIMIAMAVPLHLGIAVCMGMITFGLAMIFGNVAFVSPGLVRGVVDGVIRKLGLIEGANPGSTKTEQAAA